MAVASLEAQLLLEVQNFNRNVASAVRTFESGAQNIERSANRTTKAVSKLHQFIGTAMKAAVGIGLGTILLRGAANIRNVGKEAVMGAARVEQMNDVLQVLGKTAGWTNEEIRKQVDGIRDAGIEYGVAQRTLQDFIRYNLDVAKATDLARVAQDAAVLSNSNSSATLERLIHGVSTQNSLVLKTAGIQIQAGAAMDRFAAAAGRSTDSLNSSERTQAVFNAVLEEGTKIAGAYEKSLENPVKQLGSLKRVQNDVANNLGRTMFPALQAVVNRGLTPFWNWLAKSTEEGTAFNDALVEMGQGLERVIDQFTEFLGSEGGEALKSIAESILAIADSLSVFGKIFTDTKALAAALNSLAVILKLVADAARVLAPLIQALIVARAITHVQNYIAGMKAYSAAVAAARVQTLAAAKANGTLALALQAENVALAKNSAMTVQNTKLKASAKVAAVAFAAVIAVNIFREFTRDTYESAKGIEALNRALGEGEISLKGYKDAVASVLAGGESPLGDLQNQDIGDNFFRGLQNSLPSFLGAKADNRTLQDAAHTLGAALGESKEDIDRFITSVANGERPLREFEALLREGEAAVDSLSSTSDKIDLLDAAQEIDRILLALNRFGEDVDTSAFERIQEIFESTPDALLVLPGDPRETASAAKNFEMLSNSIDKGTVSSEQLKEWLFLVGEEEKRLADETAAADQAVADFAARVGRLGSTELAQLEKDLGDTGDAFATIGEKLALGPGRIKAWRDSLIATRKAQEDWASTLRDVANEEISVSQASGELYNQLDNLIDVSLENARVAATMEDGSIDAAKAEELFAAEVERTIEPLLRNAEALGIQTDGLRAAYDALSNLDGTVASTVIEMNIRFSGDLDSLNEYIGYLERAGTLQPTLQKALDDAYVLRDILNSIDNTVSTLGNKSSSSSSSSGTTPEALYGGLTVEEWGIIADEMERIKNFALDQAKATQSGVGIAVGALRAQQNLEDLQKRGVELAEEKIQLSETDIKLQESLVATLAEEAALVTATEQVRIESSENALRAAKRRFGAGIITAAELQMAEEEVAKSIEDSVGATAELESAEAKLEAQKQRLVDLDREIADNTLAQIEAVAELGVQYATVAANIDLVAEAIGNLDFTNIPGADNFLNGLLDMGTTATAFSVANLAGLTRGQAFMQIAKSFGLSANDEGDAFNSLAGLGIVGVGSDANLGGIFTPEQAAIVQGRISTANITINAGAGTDPMALAEAVTAALQMWMETNGPIPITVTSGTTAGVS